MQNKMRIQELVNKQVVELMKDNKPWTLSVVRQLKSAFQNAALQKGNLNSEISDLEAISIIRKQIKQREDSIAQFLKGGREDLAEKEAKEAIWLESYLPKPLTEEELDKIINQCVVEVGAQSKKDAGKVIKKVQEIVAGRAENKEISNKVINILVQMPPEA